MIPGAAFVKTWTFINSGTCIWTEDYRLVFESGDPMSEAMSFPLVKGNVAPGETVTVKAPLYAPAEYGDYVGFWKMENANGVRFGLGPEGKAFWVQIMVTPDSPNEFTVKKVVINVDYSTYIGSCGKKGHPVNYTAWITTNKAGTVTYHWSTTRSTSKVQSIVVYGADTVEVYYQELIRKAYFVGSVSLFIQTPNHQSFGKEKFSVSCLDLQ
jgi:hypothetical protein